MVHDTKLPTDIKPNNRVLLDCKTEVNSRFNKINSKNGIG